MSILKNENLNDSFKNAFNGFVYSFKTQRNLKYHFLSVAIVVILGFVLPISLLEWIVLAFTMAGVITAELFNTSIEILVDFVEKKKSVYAKLVKDVAASAVLFFVVGSIIIGCIIFTPKILLLIGVL